MWLCYHFQVISLLVLKKVCTFLWLLQGIQIVTARKTIFPFSRCPEKMVFPKNLRWNMIFLTLLGKMIFLFPENMILCFRRKMKDDLSQKIHGNIFSSNFLKRWPFQIWPRQHMIFLVSSEKMVFFSRKHDIFSQGRKWEAAFLRNYMKIWHFLCTRTGVSNVASRPSVEKKSKMVLSRKNTPKGDWHSRFRSYKKLQQFSVLSWRPLQAFSRIALQRRKTRNLIYRIKVWLLLKCIRLEIFYNE